MDTSNMIDITGASLIRAAQCAYTLSAPQGLGFLHFEEGGLSDNEAEGLIDGGCRHNFPLSMDYVKGRSCKFHVYKKEGRLYIAKSWYDHTEEDLKTLLVAIGKEQAV